MKTVNAAVADAIRKSHNVYAQPRLIAEWNLNRHYVTTADNIPNESEFGYEPEVFPIESITAQNRPTKGLTKARVGETIIKNSSPEKQHVRHYLASDASLYKYWCSPVPTDGSGNFPVYSSAWAATYTPETGTPDNITVVRPHVLYPQSVKANKIVVKVENSWASPKTFQLRIRTSVGSAWTTIATSGFNNSTGTLEVFWNGSGWTTIRPTGNMLYTNVAGIMFQVSSLGPGYDLDGNVSQYNNGSSYSNTTGANSFFNLIELTACMEADLSSKLINVSDTFDMSEASSVYPIGTITANVAEITLSNLYNDVEYGIGSDSLDKPGLFNNDNPESPFKNLSERNALFNLEYVYDINGSQYPVQQFRLYADDWNIGETQVTVPLRDYSKFFDTEPVPSVFWQDITVSEIIYRLCDLMGFVNYEVSLDTNHLQPTIPYFWTDGEKTLWQVADELAQATQTAIYFDAWGVLQIKSRDSAFSDTGTDWTVRGTNVGEELADLISLEPLGEAETNHVTINYYASDVTPWNNGVPTMARVWEPPEGVLALRASVLKASLPASSTDYMFIGEKDVQTWPFEGIVQIQGELISYSGKHFVYYTYTKNEQNSGGDTYVTYSNPVRRTANVTSKAQLDNLHSLTPVPFRYRNAFSGHLKIKERGLWNSEIKTHNVEANGWNCRKMKGGVRSVDQTGFSQVPSNSTAKLASTGFAATDFMLATRGQAVDSSFGYYGTRLRFVNVARAQQRGGLVFNNDGTNEAGYYIELQESSRNDKIPGKKEINLSALTTSGNAKVLASKPYVVTMNNWYDIDVRVTGTTTHRIQVYIDGRKTFDVEVSGADRVAHTGKFGMYLIGNSEVEYEYFYAVNKEQPTYAEDTSFWDMVKGGYQGAHWEQEWVYGTRSTNRREKKKYKKATKRWSNRFMDEFGPWVHEVREYRVKFDPFPVLHSEPMVSNKEVLLIDYAAGTHGAKFTLANMARRTVIAHGENALPGSAVGAVPNEVTLIHGRVVEVKEAEVITVKNDQQVKTKGKIESTIDSPWVQSRTEANNLGAWITDHWSAGADEWNATIFGNPLIEIGDIVAIDYPDQFMSSATHRYFVIGANSDFDNGIQTTLRLRRIT